MKRRWTIALTMLCGLAIFGLGALLLTLTKSGHVHALAQDVEQAKVIGRTIRLVLIAAIAAFWSRGVGLLNRRGTRNTERVLNARWRVVGWLVALEILIGYGLASAFIQALAINA